MEEPEQQPTPPARRKRDKPIKMPKNKSGVQNSSSDGDTSDGSPVLNRKTKQDISDSSPLVRKTVTKQEVASSGNSSPLKSETSEQEVTTSEVTSGDGLVVDKKIKVTSSSNSNLLVNNTSAAVNNSEQEVASSGSIIVKITKQEVMSSDGPTVNTVKQEVTSSDNCIVQEDTSNDDVPIVNNTKHTATSNDTPSVNIKQEVTFSNGLAVNKEVASFGDSKKEVGNNTEQDATKQTASEENNGPEKISIKEASTFAEEVLKLVETNKVTTSDYYSSTDLQYNEETEPPAAVVAATTSTSVATSATIAKMKARGHARAHSAPLMLEEDEAVVPDDKSKEQQATATVNVVNATPTHPKIGANMDTKPAPPIVVHYLGPLVLRKEVESLIIREGVSYLERQDFPTLSPTVYWNLVSTFEYAV